MEIAGRPACCAYPHPRRSCPSARRRSATSSTISTMAAWYEPVPAMVLRSIQGGEGDDAGLGRCDADVEADEGRCGPLAWSACIRVTAPPPTATCSVSLRANAFRGAARMPSSFPGLSTAWVIPGSATNAWGPSLALLLDADCPAHAPGAGRPLVSRARSKASKSNTLSRVCYVQAE